MIPNKFGKEETGEKEENRSFEGEKTNFVLSFCIPIQNEWAAIYTDSRFSVTAKNNPNTKRKNKDQHKRDSSWQ